MTLIRLQCRGAVVALRLLILLIIVVTVMQGQDGAIDAALASRVGTLIYGNGTKTTYNYASSDFVTSGLGHLNKTALFTSTVEGKATLGGATTSLASRDYQYSNLGMVSSLNKSIHSSLAAGITSLDYSFSYDDKGRLQGSTLATGGMNIYELTMGYNAVGGITSKDSDLPNGVLTH